MLVRRIVGDSMLPTLAPGKIVVGLWPRALKAGDVVMIRHRSVDKVKRVQAIVDNKLFLVGDNLASSTDSRDFGWIDSSLVVAKVFWF